MAVGLFIAGYFRRDLVIVESPRRTMPCRVCRMDLFTAQITADGGRWREVEVLGDRAIVRVEASTDTLQVVAAAPGMMRIPKSALDETLADLTDPQRNAIRQMLLDGGHTIAELTERLGTDLAFVTVRQVFRFMARRRLKPRYDANADAIVVDGIDQACNVAELERW